MLSYSVPLSSEAHGDMAVELAEPYYLYGKALIEMARSESTLLGTGIPGTVKSRGQPLWYQLVLGTKLDCLNNECNQYRL